MTKFSYLYYLYGLKRFSMRDINIAFSYGLTSDVGPDLNGCTIEVGENPRDLVDVAKCSRYKCVFVIRIPKMFLQPKIKDYKLTQIPIPIWQADTDGTYILKSNLIHSAYDIKKNKYYINEFYNEVYNPNGLLFDRQQSLHFAQNKITKWMAFDEFRQKHSFVELKRIDRHNTIWRPAITQYTDFYNKAMVKTLDTQTTD